MISCALDLVQCLRPLLRSRSFLSVKTLLGARLEHDLIELLLTDVSSLFLDLLFEFIDGFNIFSFFLMALLLGEVLQSLMELFIFILIFLLIELLYFLLLL